jgi:hypothetical protein
MTNEPCKKTSMPLKARFKFLGKWAKWLSIRMSMDLELQ